MNITWKQIGAAGAVVAGVATIHGLTSNKWRDIHTLGVILGVAAAIAPKLG